MVPNGSLVSTQTSFWPLSATSTCSAAVAPVVTCVRFEPSIAIAKICVSFIGLPPVRFSDDVK